MRITDELIDELIDIGQLDRNHEVHQIMMRQALERAGVDVIQILSGSDYTRAEIPKNQEPPAEGDVTFPTGFGNWGKFVAAEVVDAADPESPECSCAYPNPRWGDTNPSCEVHGKCFESARAEMADYVQERDEVRRDSALLRLILARMIG